MHYVARVVIEKVTPAEKPQYANQTGKERQVEEVATVVTKAADLTTLIKKVDTHLAAEIQMSEDD